MMEKWEFLPGETPLDDISGLKLKEVRTRKQLSLVEAQNVLKATVKYLAAKPNRRLAPFDLNWFLKLHGEMFGDVWEWAGKPRRIDLNIGVAWHQVELELHNLVNDLEYWEANWPDVLEQAVYLHHRAVHVHPFMNGNGRWARMLANIWLRLHDCEVTRWPEEAIGIVSPIRNEYLTAIQSADQGEMRLLLDLHRRFSERREPNDESP
jgi:Fic-DOC domain mobile mystery protein B